jgi:hypothetical protein
MAIQGPISLDARPLDGTSLTAVEHPSVDGRTVGGAGHESVKDIEFAHQMTFADAPNRGIATHLAKILGTEADQRDASASPRSRGCRFGTRMPSTNDQNIKHAAL